MLVRAGMSLTREDLHLGLHRFATKHDLERFATKQELAALRDDAAKGFEATRRHVDAVADDLTARIREMLENVGVGSGVQIDRPVVPSVTSPSREPPE